MKYKHKKLGTIIEVTSVIGGDWELIPDPHNSVEKKEQTEEKPRAKKPKK